MFNGKMKALTFSFDDCVKQDKKLIEILDRYFLKCTFNINSMLFGQKSEVTVNNRHIPWVISGADEIAEIYKDHEIAAHTLTHPCFAGMSSYDVAREFEEDRRNLSRIAGYEVVGSAYPGGTENINEEIIRTVREHTGVKYARTTTVTHNFELPADLYALDPTVHHRELNCIFELGREFLALDPDSPKLFYIWGHAYEFDAYDDGWEKFEEFCKLMSGRDDIFYGTNTECLKELF